MNKKIANELLKIVKELVVREAKTFSVTDEFSKEKKKIAKEIQALASGASDNFERNDAAARAAGGINNKENEKQYEEETDRWYKCYRILDKAFKDIVKIK